MAKKEGMEIKRKETYNGHLRSKRKVYMPDANNSRILYMTGDWIQFEFCSGGRGQLDSKLQYCDRVDGLVSLSITIFHNKTGSWLFFYCIQFWLTELNFAGLSRKLYEQSCPLWHLCSLLVTGAFILWQKNRPFLINQYSISLFVTISASGFASFCWISLSSGTKHTMALMDPFMAFVYFWSLTRQIQSIFF